jgi:hypothetical protein
MKKILPLLFSFFFLYSLQAQVGVSLSYRNINAPYWGLLLGENETIFKNGHSFSADYWLKLNNVRIDLLPEVGFSKFSNEISAIGIYPKRTFIAQFFNFQINANIYPLDFFKQHTEKDSRNPTENVARSVFVQISPGASMVYLSYRAALESMLLPPRQTAFFIGLGAGFDIHYRNYLTLTPMLRYQHYPSVQWTGLSEIRDEYTDDFFREDSFVDQLAFSIRLGVFLQK